MELITTTKGLYDPAQLQRKDGLIDNDDERTTSIEYWLGGDEGCDHKFDKHSKPAPDGSFSCLRCSAEMVHRSAHVTLKKMPVFAEPAVASFR